MTLGTHAVAGAFVGALASQSLPAAAVAAFASHFFLDSIPHWDYAILSLQKDAGNELNNDMGANRYLFMLDLMRTGADAGLGLLITLAVFSQASTTVLVGALVGAVFGALPDALQFVYWKFRHEPLISLQRFHLYMHAKTDLNNEPVVGILSQLVVVLLCVVASVYLFI